MQNEYDYKKWANAELIDHIRQIDADAFPEKHRLAVRLLNHTYVTDQIFKAHILGEEHGYHWANTDETPVLTELQKNIAHSDQWFIDYVMKATDDTLDRLVSFTFTDGDKGSMTVREILSHLLIHGAYHRGNIGMILADCGVDKPTDIFTRFLHMSQPQRRV